MNVNICWSLISICFGMYFYYLPFSIVKVVTTGDWPKFIVCIGAHLYIKGRPIVLMFKLKVKI